MKKYHRIVIFLVLTIFFLLALLLYARIFDETIYLTLFGDTELTLYQGDAYIEYGYIALNNDSENVKNRVLVKNNVNTSVIGEYEVVYQIKTKLKTYQMIRKVKVIEDDLKEINFSLKGSSIVNLSVGDEYHDPSFICIQKETGEDLKRYVAIENNINNQKAGTYEIIYRLRYNGKKKTLIRRVYVFKQTNSYKISTLALTNKPVSVEFTSNIYNFSHVVCPNDTIKYTNSFSYNFYDNGDYKFYVVDTLNNYTEYVIKINNIDRIAPTGKCSAILQDSLTNYEVMSNDSDIKFYWYNNEKKYISNESKYIAPLYQRDAKVLLEDLAGNKTLINCTIEKKYQKALSYLDDDEVMYSATSDTLQVKISFKDGYYLSHIWCIDPYIQTQKEMLSTDAKELLYPKKILEQALQNNNLYDKIIWSSNASGIVLKGTYYKDLAKKSPIYNLKEPSSLLVYKGKVIINDYEKYAANTYIYYINASNKLSFIVPLKNKSVMERKQVFDLALQEGINNTFAFNDVLVNNSEVMKVSNDYYALRNGFCQLDENNFLSVVSDTRRWNKDDFALFMKNLGCKVAVNFDGGGSNALFVKGRNESITTLTGGKRAMSSIIYFSEI